MNHLRRNLVLTLLLLFVCSQTLLGQTQHVQHTADLGDFTKEIMIIDFKDGKQYLVMWLPFEFYISAALSDGKMSKASAESTMQFLKPFITLAVQAGIDQPDGSTIFATEKELAARAVLRMPDGTEERPVDRIPPSVSGALAAMKAVITADGGKSDAAIHFLVFPAVSKKGTPIIDTKRKEELNLILKADPKFKEKSFTWRTPFDSVVGTMTCEKCKAGLSAKWTYCPYCGQKLPNE